MLFKFSTCGNEQQSGQKFRILSSTMFRMNPFILLGFYYFLFLNLYKFEIGVFMAQPEKEFSSFNFLTVTLPLWSQEPNRTV